MSFFSPEDFKDLYKDNSCGTVVAARIANEKLESEGVVEKSAYDDLAEMYATMLEAYTAKSKSADKLADHLELAIAGIRGAKVDVKFLDNRLKDFRGEK